MKHFNNIYKQYYPMMYRVAIKLLSDKDIVNDILQEVFIYLYEQLQQKKEIKHYSSWLYRATYNKCIDHIRAQTKKQQLVNNHENEIEDIDTDKTESNHFINTALNKLKPEEKLLAVLYSEGLSYKEMSEVTGIKFSSIGKTLSRILKKLEQELKGKEYELFG